MTDYNKSDAKVRSAFELEYLIAYVINTHGPFDNNVYIADNVPEKVFTDLIKSGYNHTYLDYNEGKVTVVRSRVFPVPIPK